jgi:hypothetical protein
MAGGALERRADGHAGVCAARLPSVAAKAHARNGVTGAVAHCFDRWAWAQANLHDFRTGMDGRHRCLVHRFLGTDHFRRIHMIHDGLYPGF